MGTVTRTSFTLADGQTVSALAWGDAQPELVLLHRGGQNAHTWDTVALALARLIEDFIFSIQNGCGWLRHRPAAPRTLVTSD